MQDIPQLLKRYGYRVTAGRVQLLELLEVAGKPLTIRDILKRAKGDLLDQVTLYRALESFSDRGIVLRGIGQDGTAHFSYPAKMHHHHLVCIDCGFIKSCTNC